MAEAYYNQFTNSSDASSAGVLDFTPAKYGRPTKEIIQVMEEEGIDVSQKKVKLITEEMVAQSDRVFVMCEKKECPDFLLSSDKVIFWNVSDPHDTGINNIRKTRDIVKSKVLPIL